MIPLNTPVDPGTSAVKLEWWRDRYFSGALRHFWPPHLDDLEVPLILDKRVATALRRWDVPGVWPDGGWTATQYASYLNFSQRQPVEPEEVEKTLFVAGDRRQSVAQETQQLEPGQLVRQP